MGHNPLVFAVVGDIGSAQELVLWAKLLQENYPDLDVRWIADGAENAKGHTVLAKHNIPTIMTSSNEVLTAYLDHEIKEDTSRSTLFLIGTSATARDVQLFVTRYANEKRTKGFVIRTAWLEDFYGCSCYDSPPSDDPSLYTPDEFFTIDTTAWMILRNRFKLHRRITVIGKPTLQQTLSVTDNQILTKTKDALSLCNYDLITYWSGGDSERISAHLDALQSLEPGLKEMRSLRGHRYKIIYRLHPKAQTSFQSEPFIFNEQFSTNDVPSDILARASTLNICEWDGTTSLLSVTNGVPVLALMFPDDRARRIALHYPGGLPPLVYDKRVTPVYHPEELYAYLLNPHFIHNLSNQASVFGRTHVMLNPEPLRRFLGL